VESEVLPFATRGIDLGPQPIGESTKLVHAAECVGEAEATERLVRFGER
jgi:hypothetical protein